jgi:hypothetical protein
MNGTPDCGAGLSIAQTHPARAYKKAGHAVQHRRRSSPDNDRQGRGPYILDLLNAAFEIVLLHSQKIYSLE